MNQLRVLVIGAGPSGLSQLRAFALAEKAVSIPTIVCYEKQSDWGGMWNFTWRTGLDQYGEPVHASMYRGLWGNAPKECLEFSDMTCDEFFGKPMPSYLPRQHFRDYIVGRAEKSNIRRWIQFNSVVKYVDYANEVFNVRVLNLLTGKSRLEHYDYVVVAISHFSVPNIPHFEGIDSFPGRVIHSHDLRDAKHFAGQNILVIGAGLSAEDVAIQTYKYGAKSVTISYRTKSFGFNWPKEIEELPLINRIDGETVNFKDGSKRDFDSIILCTGYQHHFPFLADDLRLTTRNRMYPDHLYKGIFWHTQPRLIYLGMQKFYYILPYFDSQAWYARDVILGRIQLPSKQEMLADIESWQAREEGIKNAEDGIDFQAAYAAQLLADTDYPKVDFEARTQMFKLGQQHKRDCIVSYRDQVFTSTCTGTKGIANSTPWIKNKQESIL